VNEDEIIEFNYRTPKRFKVGDIVTIIGKLGLYEILRECPTTSQKYGRIYEVEAAIKSKFNCPFKVAESAMTRYHNE
jgi:hypothetical protein